MFDITKIGNETIKAMWAGKEDYLVEKYQHPGIYCIKMDGHIIYVGKSKDMLGRIYDHMRILVSENLPKENKYRIIRESKVKGHNISFDVLKYTTYDEDDLGGTERDYIRELRPVLNAQIPHADNWRKWDTDKRAKYITLTQIEIMIERGLIA